MGRQVTLMNVQAADASDYHKSITDLIFWSGEMGLVRSGALGIMPAYEFLLSTGPCFVSTARVNNSRFQKAITRMKSEFVAAGVTPQRDPKAQGGRRAGAP